MNEKTLKRIQANLDALNAPKELWAKTGKIELQTTQLRTCTVVRPKGGLGTMGWWPKPWDAAVIKRRETPAQAFLRVNKKWSWNDIQLLGSK